VLTSDSQINVRYQAAITLGKVGADAKEASPQLRSALLDRYSSWELRQAAALALAGTGWELKETDPNNPKAAIWVAEPKTVAALVSIAKQDVSAKVRQQALNSLIYLGMPHNPTDLQNEKTGLQAVLKDHDPIVAIWARVALMRIDKLSEVYLKDIANQLKHPDLPVRIAAAQALGMIGPSAKSRAPDLVHALNEKDALLTMAILNALVQLADDSPTVVNGLDQLKNGTQNEALKQLVDKAKEQLKLRAEEFRKGELQTPKGPDKMKGTDPKAPKKKGP
jgi:HEAT repeat protein